MGKHVWVWVVGCFAASYALAQNAYSPALTSQHYTAQHGLSDNYITALLQDRYGFMWIGTRNGLNRFDGYDFVHYKNIQGSANSLSNNYITSLAEDLNGNIYIGTQGGLNRLNPVEGKIDRFWHEPQQQNSIANNKIGDVFADKEGIIWIGAYTVLDRFNPKTNTFTHFPTGIDPLQYSKELLSIEHITGFNGELILSVWGAGAYRFNVNTHTFLHIPYKTETATKFAWPNCFTTDQTGKLLTTDNITYVYNPTQKVFLPLNSPPKSNYDRVVNSVVIQASSGQYYVGTMGSGIVRYDSRFTSPQNLLVDADTGNYYNNFISVLSENTAGELWIGTAGNGLFKHDLYAKPFGVLKKETNQPNSLAADNIFSVSVMASGTIWIGTRSNGISIYNPIAHTFTHIQKSPVSKTGLNSNDIRSIFEDSQGNVWIGTWGGGLNRIDAISGKYTYFTLQPDDPLFMLLDNFVTGVCEDSTGAIWVTTTRGLSCIRQQGSTAKVIKNYQYAEGKGQYAPSGLRLDAVFADNNGQIWLGTETSGVSVFNPCSETFTHLTYNPGDAHSLGGIKVNVIYEDSRNRLWVGCAGGGLNLFLPNQKRFKHYTEQNGLPNDDIKGIMEDNKGNLWVTTSNGLSCFNPDAETFQNYLQQDGLPANQFALQAIAKSPKDGKIYAGTTKGLLHFYPESIEQNHLPPPVYVSAITLYQMRGGKTTGQTLSNTHTLKHLKLRHTENTFTIQFSALNYRNSALNQYAYQLQGLNNGWVFLDTKREVTFSNLPVGKYRLRVKAANNDGVWNQNPTELAITILPPWWQTGWAMLLWTCIVVALLYSGWQYQLRRRLYEAEAKRLRELDAFKTRLYDNITHEFRTPLTVILGMADQLNPAANPQQEAVNMIKRNAYNLLKLINQLLDFAKLQDKTLQLRPQHTDLVAFLQYITNSFRPYAQTQQQTLQFTANTQHAVTLLDTRLLQHIMNNLLSNALKFTPHGGSIEVRLYLQPQLCQITVTDTGIGILPQDLPHIFKRFYQANTANARAQQGTGIGLAYVQELVQLMQGYISVKSQPQQGTTFTLTLPFAETTQPIPPKPDALHELTEYPPLQTTAQPANEDTNNHLPLVLLIEDNPDVITYLTLCLQTNYRLSIAFNGQTGIEKALELIPNIIISDVMMPGKDGYEVCQTLKSDVRTSHIPIILLTAKAAPPDKITGLRSGADDYLTKPFDQEELLLKMERMTALQQRYLARYAQSYLATPPNEQEEFEMEDAFIQKITALLENNIADEDFALPQLCQKIGMSRSQLFRKMKALTNQSPSDFIRNYRLHAAKQLLLTTQLTVSEIAYRVGYKDLAHFSKSFTEAFGINPSSFKK
ncbi:hypothetical protein C7N43_25845 [Sphingobacteriales bacterium UPWRP_1]|nr:hypothetical protein B6N25_16020 [Sphingobacteriales bacterium TSM_CSS]PSJ74092.1 hypothetical protein C7N43_25845 [Sphingobacteriales bacterium UPWRP_1]